MKRRFTVIATHTTAHFNRPCVVLDKSALSYSIDVLTKDDTHQPQEAQPLGSAMNLDITTQDGTAIPYVVHERTLNETIPFKYRLDNAEHLELRTEIQRLRDENRRLIMIQKLQAKFKKLKRENRSLCKEINTQPGPQEMTRLKHS